MKWWWYFASNLHLLKSILSQHGKENTSFGFATRLRCLSRFHTSFRFRTFFLRRWPQKSARNSTCDQVCTHSNALDGRSGNKTETYRIIFFSEKWISFLQKWYFFNIDLWPPLKGQGLNFECSECIWHVLWNR